MQEWRRDDTIGGWSVDAVDANMEVEALDPAPATVPALPGVSEAAKLAYRSLVVVITQVPMMIDGIGATSLSGCGYVIDVNRGLVLVDRTTVNCPVCDIRITVFGSVEVPARLLFLHPTHNYGVV